MLSHAPRALGLAGLGAVTPPTRGGGGAKQCTMGELTLFAFGFYASNYLPADGSLQLIADNNALFSLLGTTYGGDGITTYALPDTRAVAPNQMYYGICAFGIYP